jgi:hypothetical protein
MARSSLYSLSIHLQGDPHASLATVTIAVTGISGPTLGSAIQSYLCYVIFTVSQGRMLASVSPYKSTPLLFVHELLTLPIRVR